MLRWRVSSRPAVPDRFALGAFDALSANVAILAADGRVVAVNRAWRAFAEENDGDDGLGSNYLRVCEAATGEDREAALQIASGIRAVLAGRAPLFELEYPCHAPHERRFFVARVTCFVQDGARYAVVAHENVTRRKLAELEVRELNRTLEARVAERTREVEARTRELTRKNEELEASNRELAEFAYVASHDLQEPLRSLGMYADLLRHRHGGRLDERSEGYLRRILEGVARARQLVRDVLTLADVAAEPDTPVLDLRTIWDDLEPVLPWPPDSTRSCASLPAVRANPAQMRQLLANLLSNAVKFRADRPLVVSLSAERDGPWVRFTLRDNGIGLAPEHAEQVFGMFRRLHGRERAGGNGIGLAVCRKVVARHGGRIWLESEEGVGTAVHFTLPVA